MDEALQRELVRADLAARDPATVARLVPLLRLATRRWFRAEVEGLEHVPADGGALVVSNASGGTLPIDVPVLAVALVDHLGPERPLYLPAPPSLLAGQAGPLLRRGGVVAAGGGTVRAVLRAGALTITFPGGGYEAARPWTRRNVVDFGGRTDYVRLALETGVPLVPAVSIGGQEAQLHLSRGEWLARLLRLERRFRYLPISVGVPFGLTPGLPPNLPLPTKIRTRVLAPIDVAREFGAEPDVAAVDAEVRRRMQDALDDLARRRRFPVLG